MTPRHAAPAVPPLRSADEIPAAFVWITLVAVAGPSFAALAYFQHELFAMKWAGAPAALTLALAVAVDTFGATAGVYWFRSRRNKKLRSWGRFFAIAAVLGSTALTCWSLLETYGGGAAALGVIPSAIVFASTKMVTQWQADRHAARDVLAEAAAAVAHAQARDTAREDEAAAGRVAMLTVLAAAQAARDAERAAEAAERDAAMAAVERELAELRAALAERPARLQVVPPSREVAAQDHADTRPLPVVGGPTVAEVAEWMRQRRAAGEPDGQRQAADAFGVTRHKIADAVRDAKALLDAEPAPAATG